MTKQQLNQLIKKIESDIESLDLSKLSLKDKLLLRQELQKELSRKNPLHGIIENESV